MRGNALSPLIRGLIGVLIVATVLVIGYFVYLAFVIGA